MTALWTSVEPGPCVNCRTETTRFHAQAFVLACTDPCFLLWWCGCQQSLRLTPEDEEEDRVENVPGPPTLVGGGPSVRALASWRLADMLLLLTEEAASVDP